MRSLAFGLLSKGGKDDGDFRLRDKACESGGGESSPVVFKLALETVSGWFVSAGGDVPCVSGATMEGGGAFRCFGGLLVGKL